MRFVTVVSKYSNQPRNTKVEYISSLIFMKFRIGTSFDTYSIVEFFRFFDGFVP